MAEAPLIIAHRGGSLEASENTMSAFRRARQLGISGVELDVRLTADEQVVVIHDLVLPSPCAAEGGVNVSERTLADIQAFNVGTPDAPEAPPTLREVLDLGWESGGHRLMIELKTGHDDAKLVQEVARVVGEATTSSGVCWGSFDADILGALHAAQPKIPLVGIVYTPEMIAAQGALPIALWASSDALAQSASIRGHLLETAPLWCWTVNTPSAAEALLAQGVQGLITDCPSHIRDSLPEDDGNI